MVSVVITALWKINERIFFIAYHESRRDSGGKELSSFYRKRLSRGLGNQFFGFLF